MLPGLVAHSRSLKREWDVSQPNQPAFREWVEDLLASEPLAGMLPHWQNGPGGRANPSGYDHVLS
jgi:hypothetical protein